MFTSAIPSKKVVLISRSYSNKLKHICKSILCLISKICVIPRPSLVLSFLWLALSLRHGVVMTTPQNLLCQGEFFKLSQRPRMRQFCVDIAPPFNWRNIDAALLREHSVRRYCAHYKGLQIFANLTHASTHASNLRKKN